MLRQIHVVVRRLEQTQEDVLHVIAHVAGLGEGGCVGNGEGHLQCPGQGLGDMGLAGAGGTDHENVALLQLHVLAAAELDALIVVVHRHRQRHLGAVLADDILIQDLPDLPGGGQLIRQVNRRKAFLSAQLLIQHAHAQIHALIADAGPGALNHPPHLLLPLAAEGAAQRLFRLVIHGLIPFLPLIDTSDTLYLE